MMSPTQTEADDRLNYVLNGPWATRGRQAEQHLAAYQPVALLDSLATLTNSPRFASAPLAKALRAHWEEPISQPEEMELRDSFDEALNTLQLLELGIETGYYEPEAVRETALERLRSLFWSHPATEYLIYYDYVAVRFLAARYDFDLGLPPVQVPPRHEEASLRFSSFLGTLEQWYNDTDIEACLSFLDEYVYLPNEYTLFREFLRTNGALPESAAHFPQLTRGFNKVIIRLNDTFRVAEEAERRYFGLFFAYWLAKLFGQSLGPAGYKAESINWIHWLHEYPQALLASSRNEIPAVTPDEEEQLRQQLAWEQTYLNTFKRPSEAPDFNLTPKQEPAKSAAGKEEQALLALLRRRLDTIETVWNETRTMIEILTKPGRRDKN